mmetsp:Transcript_2762/g.4160  ORF Transcript_2762/g.4160 Transcript_2762/m.4160 type:complete len:1396 (+) Transcript_2762:65-4252(+)
MSSRSRRSRHTELKMNSPNRGRDQSRRGSLDALQQSTRRLLRNRDRNQPSYTDPNSSDEFESESSELIEVQLPSRRKKYSENNDTELPRRRSTRGSADSLSISRSTRSMSRHHDDEEDELDEEAEMIEEEEEEEVRPSRRFTRQSASRTSQKTQEQEEAQRYTRRSVRMSSSRSINEEVHEDVEDEEEEEEEAGQKKYTFRDRTRHRRETLNVSHLGGDGQSYLRQTGVKRGSHDLRDTRERSSRAHSTVSVYREQPRLYLGGRLPSTREKTRHHRHRDRDRHHRRHFDSSSDSSSGSNSERRSKRRYRGMSRDLDGEDAQFRAHEEERLRRELASILPLSAGNMGGGMGGSVRDKASRRDIARADVTPLAVDPSLGFASVGGLDKHVRALKEMVVLPLLYPDIFKRFDTQPPRGVLFVGPPGTGKTLTARALANSLCTGGNAGSGEGKLGGRKVSFFMRKGADCLSKWVGEGERQLRLLFEQAKLYEPSIIFFDEIDGLAPVRSIKQDQIHASIVSTLLALMDGLDSRGQVVVIGATNRPDAIDPALRRPGRFDRELFFPLPDAEARRAILDIHTSAWNPPLEEGIKQWIVQASSGYCGADMKALCSEAAIISLRRAYPQVYSSNVRLEIDPSTLIPTKGDFAAAVSRVIPASRRSGDTTSRSLDGVAVPLLLKHVDATVAKVKDVFSAASKDAYGLRVPGATVDVGKGFEEEWIAALTDVQNSAHTHSPGDKKQDDNELKFVGCPPSSLWDPGSVTSRPRVMIKGQRGMSHSDVAAAALQKLESLQVFNLDLASLLADNNCANPEQALVSRMQEARRAAPCVVYLPDVTGWWGAASESLRSLLLSLLDSVPVNLPVLWLSTLVVDMQLLSLAAASDTNGTCENEATVVETSVHSGDCQVDYEKIDDRLLDVLEWLSGGEIADTRTDMQRSRLERALSSPTVLDLPAPSCEDRVRFFHQFFGPLESLPNTLFMARKKMFATRTQKLKIDTSASSHSSDTNGVKGSTVLVDLNDERDKNYMREQRVFFRAALSELLKEKRFMSLWRPVDPEQVPDYYDVITAPMDLETMRVKVDENMYPTYKHFIYDIEQIIYNAKEYNPLNSKDSRGRSIVSAAHNMLDVVETHAYGFKQRLQYDVFQRCEEVCLRRGMERWELEPSKERRHVMPQENEIFYREILRRHHELKEERAEEERAMKRKRCSETDAEGTDECDAGGSDIHTTVAVTGHAAPDESTPVVPMKVTDERSLRRSARVRGEASVEKCVENVCNGSPWENDEADIQAIPEAEAQYVGGEMSDIDIEHCPLTKALEAAVQTSSQMACSGIYETLEKRVVSVTAGWSVAQLLAIYSAMNRASREFQKHGEWDKTIEDISSVIDFYASKRPEEARRHESTIVTSN